jgi:hypothetical protein
MAPIYEYQGHRIWGLTALILLDFLTVALTPEVGAQCLDSPKNN